MKRITHTVLPLALLALAGAVGGCASRFSAKDLQAFLLKPRRPVASTEYRVLPPDTISIASRHVPEIAGTAHRIRPDGKINLPLLGEVYVANMTPAEIETRLKELSSKYYEQTDAIVNVSGYNSRLIYVFGQVSRQGPQPFTGGATVLDVLARAQPTTLAWPERIELIRPEQPQRGGHLGEKAEKKKAEAADGEVVDVEEPEPLFPADEAMAYADGEPGQAHKMVINLERMMRTGDTRQNVLLQPGDIVFVRPNPLAAVGLAIQQLLFPIRPTTTLIGTPAGMAGAAAMP